MTEGKKRRRQQSKKQSVIKVEWSNHTRSITIIYNILLYFLSFFPVKHFGYIVTSTHADINGTSNTDDYFFSINRRLKLYLHDCAKSQPWTLLFSLYVLIWLLKVKSHNISTVKMTFGTSTKFSLITLVKTLYW